MAKPNENGKNHELALGLMNGNKIIPEMVAAHKRAMICENSQTEAVTTHM